MCVYRDTYMYASRWKRDDFRFPCLRFCGWRDYLLLCRVLCHVQHVGLVTPFPHPSLFLTAPATYWSTSYTVYTHTNCVGISLDQGPGLNRPPTHTHTHAHIHICNVIILEMHCIAPTNVPFHVAWDVALRIEFINFRICYWLSDKKACMFVRARKRTRWNSN